MTLSKSVLALGAAVGVLTFASQASAAGFYLQEQSARGTGRAYSGEVADKGVASLWWNPAAIAGLDRSEVYGSVSGILVNSEVNDNGSTITRPGQAAAPVGGAGRIDDPINNGVLPSGGVAWKLTDRVALGLSVASPYSFTSYYKGDSWTRYDALKSRLLTADVQATVGYHVNDWLDLGAGVSLVYSDATLTSAMPNLSPALADGRQELRGDGWDAGWVVGAQLHPTPDLTIGASYRSKVEHKLDGAVEVSGLLGPAAAANMKIDGQASFTTPWIATLGARWRLGEKTTLNAQIQRVGWSEFESIHVALPAGRSQSIEQNYEDTTTAAVGVDYQWRPDWTLRAGVQYDPTPTPDIGRSARVPDGDRWLFAAGATKTFNDRFSVDLAASYISFDKSTIDRTDVVYGGTPLATPVNLKGTVEGSAVVLSAGARWAF
ncbi:OmpP1/FadL family transporter [Caulobacter mirabilis]|uniref:Long-chain fatty acid transporter n=1 Tax=Caulobacter mirabilis TaxID=69666 RepID=A0A2D2AWE8_9CAUL|nr:outer membrane protein transport protein [Caulobacter mirabilis]ATQ42330.1 long-chain fatty acid transporter [Caulobacter mirabilis]